MLSFIGMFLISFGRIFSFFLVHYVLLFCTSFLMFTAAVNPCLALVKVLEAGNAAT
jgi:hypothetical protein